MVRLFLFLGLLLAVTPAWAQRQVDPRDRPSLDTSLDTPLIAMTGEAKAIRDFLDKPVLLFFGYTSCADTCPTALAIIADGLERMGKRADDVQVLFINLDTDRQDLKTLKQYVGYFDSRIVGLTGPKELVGAVAVPYGVYFGKGERNGRTVISHSGYFYLLRTDGSLAERIPHTVGINALAQKLNRLIKTGETR